MTEQPATVAIEQPATVAIEQPATGAAAQPVAIAPAEREPLLMGVARLDLPTDLSVIDQYEQRGGKQFGILHWYALWAGANREFSRDDFEKVHARGAMPLVSWEPWAGHKDDPAWALRDSVLSGANDDYIESWARGLADYGKPVLLRFAQKMHDESYPWSTTVNGNTAGEYVESWRYVRTIFERHGATNVKWVWTPNALGLATATAYEPIYRSLYPGDDQVDYIGLDIYNTGPIVESGAPSWRSFGEIMAEPYRAITSVSTKPLLLTEVATAEVGGNKVSWIDDALSNSLANQFPRVVGVVWFDEDKETSWSLASTPGAFDAFVAAWKLPQFGS